MLRTTLQPQRSFAAMQRQMVMAMRTGMLLLLLLLSSLASAYPAIVLAHGKQDTPPYAIDPVVQVLRAQGFTVLTPDMPWSATRQYDAGHPAAVAQLVQAVTRLRAEGAHPVFVGGHGLGGNTALAAATQVVVQGVVLIAPAHTPDAPAFALAVSDSLHQAQALVARGASTVPVTLLDFNHRSTQPIHITPADYVSYFSAAGTAAMSLTALQLPKGVPVMWVHGLWDVLRADGHGLFFSHLPAHAQHLPLSLFNPLGNTPKAAAVDIARWLAARLGAP
jgi:pimeloyl-ACP methyl ester carboxylesterase